MNVLNGIDDEATRARLLAAAQRHLGIGFLLSMVGISAAAAVGVAVALRIAGIAFPHSDLLCAVAGAMAGGVYSDICRKRALLRIPELLQQEGRCTRCGYLKVGGGGEHCPECGAAYE